MTWSLSPPESKELGKFRPTCLMERVSRYVEAHPDVKVSEVLNDVTGKRQDLGTAWLCLVEEGYLDLDETGGDAKRLRSVREFREGALVYEQEEAF